MHTIQTFLIVVLSAFVWLTFIPGLALAEAVTIYDKDWRVEQRIQGAGERALCCFTMSESGHSNVNEPFPAGTIPIF
jgi:hypothetical protein